ncbi:tetratricopeptide repeat protein [Maribacter sp. 2307ULW6-5]|uniref:tetratricopeptide repeat protein n=1 Tax=Maribacter sp. 2307ULW6-5 TaxID=3386275 RepID=UPI0039BD08E7
MRTITFFLFMGCIPILGIYGQNKEKIDSLLMRYSQESSVREKVYLLDDLNDYYIYSAPDSAKKIIEEMIAISKADNYKHGILRGEFLLGHYYSTIGLQDTAAVYFRKTLERTKRDNDDTFLATALKNLSIYESHLGNYPEAIRLMDSSAAIQYGWEDFMRYGSGQSAIGRIYYEMGNYPKAMEMYQAALKTLDTIAITSYHKADVLGNIGGLHNTLGNYDEALRYYAMAMTVYEQTDDHLYQANTLIDMGNVYLAKGQYDQALAHYQSALDLGREYDFPTVRELAFANMGHVHKATGRYTTAIAYLRDALDIEETETSSINRAQYLAEMGHAQLLAKAPREALAILDKAVALADSVTINNELQTALAYRALVHQDLGSLEEAISDLKRSQVIKDSLFSLQKTKHINELHTLYETEKKEAEIALQKEEINTLNERAKVDTLTKSLYAGGFFTFVAVSGLLFFGFRQRIKKNRMAREKQEAIYKQEIEHKKKELASQTLHLVQKNTFIQELMENLESIKNSPEKFKMEFRRIVMLLKKENASDKDWEVFKTYFAEVHNDFDQKLKTLYADISEKEIRLAAFLRMNLTTKEIAATLNVLPDSILKSKYRLKKKLNLDKDTDLTSFLNGL